MAEKTLSCPEPRTADHDVSSFDCGHASLNTFLKKFAGTNHQTGSARTYVATRGKRVVGFYSLSYGSVEYASATSRIRRGLARHPIPVMVLARLAVDRTEQGHGMGRGLLKDALLRTLQAADIAGLRAIIVHAKNESARSFYERFDFIRSPIDEFRLMLLLKDVRKLVTD
jgi:GNAT superfamily N-acetyltransferase